MFGFKKKKQKPLWIMAKDVMDLIQSDYETDMSFTLIEFLFLFRLIVKHQFRINYLHIP